MFNVEWEKFKNYLIDEEQFDNKKSNMDANKSRFNRLTQFFSTREFTRENFANFVGEMRENELSPATQNKHISLAKQIDKYLNYRDKIPLILANFKYKKVDDLMTHQIFTVEEMIAIRDCNYFYGKFNTQSNLRAKAMFGVLIDTGCRSDEVCELKWNDVAGGEMPSIAFRQTKTVNSRTNFITPETYRAIQQLPKKSKRVFSTSRGNKLKPPYILEDLHKRADALGIKKRVWTHLFRITFITMLINAEVDWFAVAAIVGHKDPKTTQRYYQKSLEPQRRAVSRHPIFKQHLTHMQNLELVKEFFQNSVNTGSSNLIIRDEGDALVIRIEKKGFYEHQI